MAYVTPSFVADFQSGVDVLVGDLQTLQSDSLAAAAAVPETPDPLTIGGNNIEIDADTAVTITNGTVTLTITGSTVAITGSTATTIAGDLSVGGTITGTMAVPSHTHGFTSGAEGVSGTTGAPN